MQVRERQVRERQRDGGVAPAPPAGQGIARGGRRRPTGAAAISAAILSVLLLVTLSVMNGGVSSRRDARPASAAVVETPDFTITEPSRLQRAVRWIDGLAAGLILTHEITSRLAVQDPGLARVVQAAWSDLAPVAGRVPAG